MIWLYLLNNNDACDDADDCHSNNDDENISYNDNNETMTSREKKIIHVAVARLILVRISNKNYRTKWFSILFNFLCAICIFALDKFWSIEY